MRTFVAVIGDLGRSPRMLAHIAALLRAGHDVHALGEIRSPLPATIADNPRLHLHPLNVGQSGTGRGGAAAISTALRGLALSWRLARTMLIELPAPDVILLQTPPGLPLLPVALLAARWRGGRVIVDWHNVGWALLALRFGSAHPLVRVTRWVELFFGRRAAQHLAVSQRLADYLSTQGIASAIVLLDGPSEARPMRPAPANLPHEPVTVVAPMGWSRDDDLGLLADALALLARRAASSATRCRGLRVLVSGDGPRRSEWAPRLRALSGPAIQVETPDVPPDEYPQLLANSHLGLSVHRSASKLDLPMKLIELRAVGVPAFVLEDGSPLDEIASAGCGVRRYGSAAELADMLFDAIADDATTPDVLRDLRAESRAHPPSSWDARWDAALQQGSGALNRGSR